MAPFVEFDLSAMIHSTTESVRLYGTPVLTGGKLLNMLTVRSGLLAVSCCGLVVPGARNTHCRNSDRKTTDLAYLVSAFPVPLVDMAQVPCLSGHLCSRFVFL